MSLASTLLRNDVANSEVLQARQEMLALAKLMVHSGDSPPDLLASALVKLAVAYSNMSMYGQALAHCTDAVALAYRLHTHHSAGNEHAEVTHMELTSVRAWRQWLNLI